MAREYTAFISYRHCPLDIAVAETLHKRIERFRVPKDLREDGQVNLGVVFRDRDELPLSNNLTQDIYEALDHAKFLIVVCTPETPKSIWVEREIEYFIEKHGRERILTVLAAGTPEESIPKIITHIYAPDGKTVVDRMEPLCAFLVAEDESKVLKNLNKEFLRLVAAILGCHYDALIQRQKRYRAQMISYAVGVLAVVALLFVGMLVNRNREIAQKNQEIAQKNQEIEQRKQELEAQLRQTQINESQALTLLSRQKLAEGDRLGAIKSALNALPHDGDGRPYSAAAEGALADALNIYSGYLLDYYLTIEQPVDVFQLTLSDDGWYLVTVDTTGCLRCFDTLSTAMLWEHHLGGNGDQVVEYSVEILEIIEDQDAVLYSNQDTTYSLSLETGEILNSVSFYTERNDSCSDTGIKNTLSPDKTLFAQISQPDAKDVGTDTDNPSDQVYCLKVYRTDTFELIYRHIFHWDENWEACYPDFSLDGRRLAVLFSNQYKAEMKLFVLDTTIWEIVYQQVMTPSEEESVRGSYTHLAWLPNDELLLYYEQRMNAPMSDQSRRTYFIKLSETGEYEEVGPYYTDRDTYYDPDAQSYEISHYLTDTHIYYNVNNASNDCCVFAIELDTLQRTSNTSCNLAGSYLRKNGSLMLAVSSGEIGYITGGDGFLEDYHIYQHEQNIRVAAGVSGEREILCLVPEAATNTVVIVSESINNDTALLESPAMEKYGSSYNSLSRMDYAVFPSGKAFLTIDLIKAGAREKRIAVTIYNALTLEIIDSFIIESKEYFYFSGFSADETKLFFRGLIYDIPTRTLSEYENGSEVYGEHAGLIYYPEPSSQMFGTPLLAAYERSNTIYWWIYGANLRSSVIPYDMETFSPYSPYSKIKNIGCSGLFVQPLFEEEYSQRTNAFGIFSTVTEEWHLLDNPVNGAGFPVFSVGNTERVIAFADFDRVLRVYDFDKDAIIHEWPLTVSPDSITKMLYLAKDQYLLIYTETDNVHLINMRSGTELGSYYLKCSNTGTICADECRNTGSICVEDGVAYVYGDSETLRIDLVTGELLATIPDMLCYLPDTNRAICVRGEQLTAIPIYTWEELAQKGWDLIHTIEENRIS